MNTRQILSKSLSLTISAAQDHAANLSGDERFFFDCWLTDLTVLRHQLAEGSPYRAFPPDPQDREDALDNHPAVKAITGEKAA